MFLWGFIAKSLDFFNRILFIFLVPTLLKCFYKHPCSVLTLNPLQTSKNEEEEFNTGPLSVLMMSVKNNTQVCFVCACLTVAPCNSQAELFS